MKSVPRGSFGAVLSSLLLCCALLSSTPACAQPVPAPRPAPTYVPDRVVVKLVPEATLGALGRGGRALPAGLARAWSLARVHQATPLFADLWPDGASRPVRAADRSRAVRARFPQRAARAMAEVPDPDLENVLVLSLAPGTSVPRALAALRADPSVVYAEPDRIVTVTAIANDPYYLSSGSWGQPYPDMWGLYAINAAAAWDVTTGSDSVLIGIVDTGIDATHPDLAGRIWTNPGEIPGNGLDDDGNGFIDDVHGWNFVDNNNDPVDGFGHGTHVAGTIAAATNNTTGVAGLNWSGKILPIKGLSDTSGGTTTALARAMRYAADNGADVMNNSWGGYGTEQLVQDVINHCYAVGCIVVAAAGNNRDDVQYYEPAGLANVVTVAASQYGDGKADFSNYGTPVDVSAPGVDILSLRAANTDMYADGSRIVGGYYYRSDGTSMACPHVVGSLALLLAAHPTWSTADIIGQLVGTVDSIDGVSQLNVLYENQIGLGRINVGRALTGTVQNKRLALVGYQIDDSAGDSDGLPDAGERINVIATLKHFTGTSENVTLTLSCADPRITIVTPTVSLGTVSGWRRISNAGSPLVFDVGAGYTDTAPLVLTLTIAATGYQSTDEIRLYLPAGDGPVSSYLPAAMAWGGSKTGTLVGFNYDLGAWEPGAGYQMVAREGADRWGTASVPLLTTVDPYDPYSGLPDYGTFSVPLTAPPVTTLRYPWDASATTPPRNDGLRSDWDLCLNQTPLNYGHAWQNVVISRFPDIGPDTDAFWARISIEECAGRVPPIVTGYTDGRYGPADLVTRAAMAVYLTRTLKLPVLAYQGTFPDVPSSNWAALQVEALARAGIVKGLPDGTYAPDNPVNRDQMAIYVARAMAGGDAGVPPGPATPTFPDVPSTATGYKYTEYAVAQGVVKGYTDGLYHPAEVVTRAQMPVYLYRGFLQSKPIAVVLAGPAITAVSPTDGTCGWRSAASGPAAGPGHAYVAFDALRLGDGLAFGGTWEVTFELRNASTPDTPATGAYATTRSFAPADFAAAQAATRASGNPYFVVPWDLPAGLAPGNYVLVVSIEDETGTMWTQTRRPAFAVVP